jgi:hypothetical protein
MTKNTASGNFDRPLILFLMKKYPLKCQFFNIKVTKNGGKTSNESPQGKKVSF